MAQSLAKAPLPRGRSRDVVPDTVGARMRELRIGMRMTQAIFADAIHSTNSTVSRYETNEIPVPEFIIERLATLARVPKAFIRDGDTSSRLAPVVGYVGAGAEVYAPDEALHLGGIEVPASWTDAVAMTIRGDSCLPVYAEGGTIIVRGDQRFDPEEALRRMCVLELDDGRGLVKEPRRTPDPGRFDLWSPNAAPIEDVVIVSARPVRAYFPPE